MKNQEKIQQIYIEYTTLRNNDESINWTRSILSELFNVLMEWDD